MTTTMPPARRRPGPAGPNLDAGLRLVLARMIAAHPSEPDRLIRDRFVAATGREITRRSVSLHRTRAILRRAAPDPRPEPAPPGLYPGLPRDQAAALAWIANNRPDLSPIECVALLAAEMERDS